MMHESKMLKRRRSPSINSWPLPPLPPLAPLLYLSLLLLLCVLQAAALAPIGDGRVRREDARTRAFGFAGFERQNVSCIAHDTKFTCDCRQTNQQMQLPHLIGSVFQVEISNCRWLSIEANVLEETQGLRKITFRNVDALQLHKYALAFPRYASHTPLIIEFDKVNFELIDSHAINGNIEEISFIGGRIDVIHPFGFATLHDRALLLKMERMWVKKIEPQAFKKFAVEELEITNCVFDTNVPSKAFYELEVLNTLRIENSVFKEVHSHAFSFKMIGNMIIANNRFDSVDAEWLEAHVRDSIVVRGNYFGATSAIAFKGVAPHQSYRSSERLELRFTNNTLRANAEPPRPLELNERFALNIKELRYENVYACKDLDMAQKPPQPRTTFFAAHRDAIYFRRALGGGGGGAADRGGPATNQSFVALSKIIELDCQARTYTWYIVGGVVALLVVLLLVAIVVWRQLAKRRKRRKMDVVVPEPRTYKETQIVYQIENAGLLKTDL